MCTTTSWYKRFKFRMDGEWKIENGKIKWKIKKKIGKLMFFRFYFYIAESVFSAFIIDIHTFYKNCQRQKKVVKLKIIRFINP